MFSLYKSKKGRVLWGLGRVCPFVAVATAATYCHYDYDDSKVIFIIAVAETLNPKPLLRVRFVMMRKSKPQTLIIWP